MLKMIGIFLVFVSSTLGGFYFASKDSYRIKDLKEIKKALKILEGEIIYARNEVEIALDNVACRLPSPISNIFSNVFNKENEIVDINNSYNENMKNLWTVSLENSSADTFLIKQDIEYLKGVGDLLGYLDVTMQKNALEMYIVHIDDEIAILNENREKNRKMYQSLGVLTELLVIILFI